MLLNKIIIYIYLLHTHRPSVKQWGEGASSTWKQCYLAAILGRSTSPVGLLQILSIIFPAAPYLIYTSPTYLIYIYLSITLTVLQQSGGVRVRLCVSSARSLSA